MALRETGWIIDYATLETDTFLAAMIEAFQADDFAPGQMVLSGAITSAGEQSVGLMRPQR